MSPLFLNADAASFRDPSGRVYRIDDRIFRLVFPAGANAFETVWASSILQKLADQKRLIRTALLPACDPVHDLFDPGIACVLTHPTFPCITYPYEWPFSALKSAAIAHLDLQLYLLDQGFVLSDASAFNMQFDGAHPVHIDVLSVLPYREGMRWAGYRQFLHQFFNPLVLESRTGVSFAPFFRATLEGVSSDDMLRLLPCHTLLRPGFLLHIVAPAWGERYFHTQRPAAATAAADALPRTRYRGLLLHLRSVIEALQPCYKRTGGWMDYTSTTSYCAREAEIKKELVQSFIQSHRPKLLLDIGCNTGDYAALALEAGTERVIGLDSDRASADAAFRKSAAHRLRFLPLVMDITNPSPSQGWRNIERRSLTERIRADCVIALAIIHHLCIGKNIPLSEVMEFAVSLAPRGIIEFVPKSDPQVVELLRFREDIFPDYGIEAAKANLLRHARILNETRISESGRIMLEFERAA